MLSLPAKCREVSEGETGGSEYPIEKTHDLDKLLSLLLPVEPSWVALRPTLLRLNDYAVEFRYPGHEATAKDGKSARQDARAVRKDVRSSLGVRT